MTKPVVGFVGLGCLGLPLAVAVASRGFKVLGYDVKMDKMRKRQYEHRELGPTNEDDFQKHFDEADLTFLPLKDLLQQADIVFVVVQTPHGPQYEGVTKIPYARADFDYVWLKEASVQVSKHRRPDQVIVVSSTVLPGTLRREIIPLIPDVCYNPAFPAMGTVMENYLNPEFVLLSGDYNERVIKLESFYRRLLTKETYPGVFHCPPIKRVSIESAELLKVSYNTFITAKITLTNNVMEIAHKIPGCSCDEVSDVLSLANKRICSSAYMRGGMGGSGGCYLRDCVAMSWLSEKLNLSCDLFDSLMHAREFQTEWLVHLFTTLGKDMRKVVLGKTYKPESYIITGSSAILFANLLKEKEVEFVHYDPYVDLQKSPLYDLRESSAIFIATKHDVFKSYSFPRGSLVLDPFRYIPQQDGVRVIPIGIGRA